MRNVFALFLPLFTAEKQGATAFDSCAQLSSGNYRCDYFGMLSCTPSFEHIFKYRGGVKVFYILNYALRPASGPKKSTF